MSKLSTVVKETLRRAGWELRRLDASFAERQRTLLAASDLVVDVGANAGQFGSDVRAQGYTGRLVSFEPERDAYTGLVAASAADPSWEARRMALADRDGEAALTVAANSVSSSLLPMLEEHVRAAPASRPVGTQLVETSTLDAELAGMPGQAWFLKLDVQGAESVVLQGGPRTMTRVTAVRVELSLRPLYDGQADFLDLLGTLYGLGFEVCHLLPGFRDRRTGDLLQADALLRRRAETERSGGLRKSTVR